MSENLLNQYSENPIFKKSLSLTKRLINEQSITPDKSKALNIIADELLKIGFTNEWLNFEDVKNLYCVYKNNTPTLMFAGHSDVVPVGKLDLWKSPPFEATIINNQLFGRGSADMKSAIACFVAAVEYFIKNHQFQGSIAFLITADEEGPAKNGTKKVVEELLKRNEKIEYCVVGEPSSNNITGDTIKNGRRGSLNGKIIFKGKQGHIAYPHLADNPIHKIADFLKEMVATKWDQGNDFFEPTCFQCSNIQAGYGAENIIPNDCTLNFNFRYSPELTSEDLKQKVQSILEKHKVDFEIFWNESGKPFFSKPSHLSAAIKKAINKTQAISPKITTGGGTSDGRFVIELGCEIIELGLTNKTIHQINESISLTELNDLGQIYYQTLINLFSASKKPDIV